MPISEKFTCTRPLSTVVGTWIELYRVEVVAVSHGSSSGGASAESPRDAMIMHTSAGQFYATPYVRSQLACEADVSGFYQVEAFVNKSGQSGIALRNLPPQHAVTRPPPPPAVASGFVACCSSRRVSPFAHTRKNWS